MTISSLLVLLPGLLAGGLLIHLLWPDRRAAALLLKASLGAGLGLGLSSFLYLADLAATGGRIPLLPVLLLLALTLALVTLLRERRSKALYPRIHGPSRLQSLLLAADLAALAFLLLTFMNLTISRPQGAFDAWSIWNRAARFIYRDPENWRATLSPDLYWGNHPDYPLLVPLNVAWGWQSLGEETQRMPMVQGAIFTLAALGVTFSALSLARTTGQASLAALVLMATPAFVLNGSALIADIPVAYFILATCVLIYLSRSRERTNLLLLAGLMAGLAGWSKNEGLLFILVSPLGAWLAHRESPVRPLMAFLAGLALPVIVILFFKSISPPGDLFAGGSASLAKIADPSRWWIILRALGRQVVQFGDSGGSILIGLAVYALVMRAAVSPGSRPALLGPAAILLLQLLGYCLVYLLTPHDLEWHLGTSLARLILHIYPAGVFLLFCLTRTPEDVFGQPAHSKPRQESRLRGAPEALES